MNKYFIILMLSFSISLCSLNSSISTESLGKAIASSIFVNQNKFYVGANEPNGDNSIASIELSRGTDGQLKASFVGKSPESGINLNGTSKQQSCMFDQKIDNLAAQTTPASKTYLVATHNVPNEDSASFSSIALIDFSNKITAEFSNTTKITDAAGAELKNNDYAALTASPDTIFVAVPPSAGIFGAANSGITRLKKATTTKDGMLTQQENGQSKAYTILLPATLVENITQGSVNIATQAQGDQVTFSLSPIADMFWDTKLNCLYIGLTNATTSATTPQAGACSLLVGHIDNNQLFIRTAIPLSVALQPGVNSVIYYSTSNPSQKAVSTFKVRTMHTSTGKDYVILVGDVSDAGGELVNKYKNTQVNVYSLPLASLASDATTNGMIATKNSNGTIDFNTAVNNSNLLMNKTNDATRMTVGVSSKYLVHASTDAAFIDAAITDIQIIGDSVFVSVAGTRGSPNTDTAGEAGIFTSTAIFASDGSIRAWTPWIRATCTERISNETVATDKVFSVGIDKNTSNAWYTTKDPDNQGIVTQWSTGAANLHNDKPLSTVLTSFFNDNYRVINLINFDDETPGFLSWDPSSEYPAFSMMVATGYNKVALIQTGKRDVNNVFQPTTEFLSTEGDTQNVFNFSSSDVKIGQISCAEVSRSNEQDKGWLFIGGSDGLSVIRSDNDGTGWTNLNSLDNIDFPGTDYSFKILTDSSGNNFSNIIKLIADGTYLYVITSNTTQNKPFMYVITMNADDFYTGKISTSNLRSIKFQASLGTIFDALLIDNANQLNSSFAFATELGIQIATLSGDYLLLRTAQDAQTVSQHFVSGPALKFNFVSTQKGVMLDANKKADGNLYVTTFNNQTLNNLFVFRFNVQTRSNDQAQTVDLTLFNEPYNEPGFTQKYFYKIANFSNLEKRLYLNKIFDLSTQLHHFTNSLAITPDPEKFLPDSNNNYKAIDLGIKTNKIPLFGIITQDTASGTQYISGSFGLVANE